MTNKFLYKGLRCPEDLLALLTSNFTETKESWSYMLAHQIKDLEGIEKYIEKYKYIVNKLFLTNYG